MQYVVLWFGAVKKHHLVRLQVCFRLKSVQLVLPVHSLAYTSFDCV